MKVRPVLFLDRDGVINIDYGYVSEEKQFHFTPDIFQLVSLANKAKFLVIVVTNQSGIARGLYTKEDFSRLSAWMKNKFKEKKCIIDAIYFCPHHPEGKIKHLATICKCRKPEPGMLLRAFGDFRISVTDSIMVGDKSSDIEAGYRAGIEHLFLYQPNIDIDQPEQFELSNKSQSIRNLLDPALTSLMRIKST